MAELPVVDDGNWEALMVSPVPVLVDYYTPGCSPCKLLSPVLEQLADEFAGKLEIVKVNIEKSPNLGRFVGVRSVPTMVMFDDGEMVDMVVGYGGRKKVKEFIEGVING